MDTRPTIAISMGDPLGIGPEVTLKALADASLRGLARFVVHGHNATLTRVAERGEFIAIGRRLIEHALRRIGLDPAEVDQAEMTERTGFEKADALAEAIGRGRHEQILLGICTRRGVERKTRLFELCSGGGQGIDCSVHEQ